MAQFVASEWFETDTALVWKGAQTTPAWKFWRRARLTGSIISRVTNRSLYHVWNKQSNIGLASAILGVDGYSTGPAEPNEAMKWGVHYEPIARKMLQTILDLDNPIQEVGLAIYKDEDDEKHPHGLFAASADGILDDKEGVEIKCPQRMPEWALKRAVDHETPIDTGWYDQVQMTGAIYGVQHVWLFVVPKFQANGALNSTAANKTYFLEKVPIYPRHWHMLRHKALQFYHTYMAPLVKEDPLLLPEPVHEHLRRHHRGEDPERGARAGEGAEMVHAR
jgi:hypothetical protein